MRTVRKEADSDSGNWEGLTSANSFRQGVARQYWRVTLDIELRDKRGIWPTKHLVSTRFANSLRIYAGRWSFPNRQVLELIGFLVVESLGCGYHAILLLQVFSTNSTYEADENWRRGPSSTFQAPYRSACIQSTHLGVHPGLGPELTRAVSSLFFGKELSLHFPVPRWTARAIVWLDSFIHCLGSVTNPSYSLALI